MGQQGPDNHVPRLFAWRRAIASALLLASIGLWVSLFAHTADPAIGQFLDKVEAGEVVQFDQVSSDKVFAEIDADPTEAGGKL